MNFNTNIQTNKLINNNLINILNVDKIENNI